MKPYQQVPIVECGEALMPIPSQEFVCAQPHPYQVLGAPYGDRSPFCLRQGVVARLLQAQTLLQAQYPGWRLLIFDAYRPIAVQQFMVDYTLASAARTQGYDPATLTADQRQELLVQVYQMWAVPSADPHTPPPHSTGGAVDLTLVDANGTEIEMGSPIDELSPRSHPDYFAAIATDPSQPSGVRQAAALATQHRQLLYQVMHTVGFQRHPLEWWHFSFGDQLWAWLTAGRQGIAHYGGCQ